MKVLPGLATLILLVAAALAVETLRPVGFGGKVLALFGSPTEAASDTGVDFDVIRNLPVDENGQPSVDTGDVEDRPMPPK